MLDKNKDVMELIFEGVNISVIKKNIFDILINFMNDQNIPIKKILIISLINDIEMKEFMKLKQVINNRKEYNKNIEKITKKTMNQYLELLLR